jgi:hypothetical protein
MKRLLTGMAIVVMLGTPVVSRAQNRDIEYDAAGPPPYNDVEDGQLLKIASYIAMPVGWQTIRTTTTSVTTPPVTNSLGQTVIH